MVRKKVVQPFNFRQHFKNQKQIENYLTDGGGIFSKNVCIKFLF